MVSRLPFVLLLLCVILPRAWTYVVDVPPRSEECFLQQGKAGEEIHLTYEVYEGGFLDIDVKVTETEKNKAVVSLATPSKTLPTLNSSEV